MASVATDARALLLCALGGSAAAAATMARLTVGVATVGIIGLVLLVTRRWTSLAAFAGGVAATILAATVYLGANGALGDWWEQSILLPRMWRENVIGSGGSERISNRLTHVAIPGLVILTLVVAAIVIVHQRTIGRSASSSRASSSGSRLAVAMGALARQHEDLPYWNRAAAFWSLALAGLVVPSVAIACAVRTSVT